MYIQRSTMSLFTLYSLSVGGGSCIDWQRATASLHATFAGFLSACLTRGSRQLMAALSRTRHARSGMQDLQARAPLPDRLRSPNRLHGRMRQSIAFPDLQHSLSLRYQRTCTCTHTHTRVKIHVSTYCTCCTYKCVHIPQPAFYPA